MAFNGVDGYALTDLPAVDTSRAFAMSAWVKLSAMPDDEAIVMEVPGNERASFALFYHAGLDRWVFKHHEADAPGGVVRAMADQPGGVVVGEWTHLLGSFSPAGGLELYVDGQLVGQVDAANLWDARRGLIFGAGLYSGTPAYFLPGAIDEVQSFDKAVNAEVAMALYEHQQIGDPGRPATALFHLDEQAGATEVAGYGGCFLPATQAPVG